MAYEIRITPELRRKFNSEATEHLDLLEKMLLALEADATNQQAVHAAFRAVHTVKGNSDYLGVADINVLSHDLESLMDIVRGGKLPVTDDVIGLLFEGLDLLREMNRRVLDDVYEETDVSDITDRVRQACAAVERDTASPAATREGVDVTAVFARASSQHVEFIRNLGRRIVGGERAPGARKNLLRVLKTFRTSAGYVGAADIVAILEQMVAELEGVRSVRNKTAERLVVAIEEVAALLARMTGSQVARSSAGPASEQTYSATLDREMKIDAERVDELLNQVSELTVAKNALNYVAEALSPRETSTEDVREIRGVAARINRLSEGLQATAMKLRLVKLSSLFERLPRIVREISSRSGKEVELTLLGGDTEIDRQVIEQLLDPMIHLIRNAIDHGIELPSERSLKSKAQTGVVTVQATQQSGYAVIDVIDDGRGLNIGAIRSQALERGTATNDVLSTMPDNEIMNLIFAPGFTTLKEATAVSGRGVGMDVVQSNVNGVGGNVTISSEEGAGTRVRLQVPLSMALLDALLVEAGGERYAFPFSAIMETIRVKRNQIQILNQKEAISYNGHVLGLQHLGTILGVSRNGQLRAKDSDQELPVIVLAFGGRARGVVVDRILRREAILAKPLEEHLAGISELSGAALLGDGGIVLILDLAGIM